MKRAMMLTEQLGKKIVWRAPRVPKAPKAPKSKPQPLKPEPKSTIFGERLREALDKRETR